MPQKEIEKEKNITVPVGVYTGKLTIKMRKHKYDFDAIKATLMQKKMYALPTEVTSISTAISIRKKLRETTELKNANFSTAENSTQFVFFVEQ